MEADLLNTVYPDVRARMRRVYAAMKTELNLEMRACQGLRTIQDQNALYAQGRTRPGKIVTKAKGFMSWHCFGVAVDSCFLGPDPFLEKHPKSQEIWKAYGQICKRYGLVWGGDFKSPVDRPHAEKTYGISLKQVQITYLNYGMKGVWTLFDRLRANPDLQTIGKGKT